MKIEDFKAHVVMIGNEMNLSTALLDQMSVSKHEDYTLRSLVYSIKTYIAASGEETIHCDIKWPADWWEAIKERWFPTWAKVRWPVRYERHSLDRTFYRAMCPHISIPKHQGNEIHFKFLKDHNV